MQASRHRAKLIGKFNMTPEQYDELLQKQNGVCAICKVKPEKRLLAVDHDRGCCPGWKSCGKCVRGLLCMVCNTRLEWFVRYAESAQIYLNALRTGD
jgi:hypothetical protein